MEEIVRLESSGIPLLWLPAAAPVDAALLFRAGAADETFARGGLCHLVEHLAMWQLGDPTYEHNAFVSGLFTNFHASGTEDEAKEFLERVAATFADLPIERLETEKQVLRTEQAGGGPDSMLTRRIGQRSFGLLPQPELSFLSADADSVRTWARERFTSANAIVLWVGPEPPPLDLRLPGPGRPTPLPPAEPLPGLRLPLAESGGDGEVIISGVVPRVPGLPIALLATERHLHATLRIEHGLVYTVQEDRERLSLDTTHVSFRIDCIEDHAAEARRVLLAELAALAADGIPEEGLDAALAIVERDMAARDGAPSVLFRAATDLLCGGELIQPSQMLEGYRSLTPRAGGDLVATFLASAIAVSPEAIPPPPGYATPDDLPRPGPVDGEEFRTKGLRRSRAARLMIGDRGLSLAAAGDGLTIHWQDVVGAVHERSGNVYLTSVDGSWMYVEPDTFTDPGSVRDAILAHLREEWMIPQARAEEAARIEALAAAHLPGRKSVAGELDRLAMELAAGEQPLGLALASKGMLRGLMAVTDRQTLFIYAEVDDAPATISVLHHTVDAVTARRGVLGDQLRLAQKGVDELVLRMVEPKGRAAELAALIDARR